LACGRQHPGEVADRRGHRLSREEGKLAHINDSKRRDDDARHRARSAAEPGWASSENPPNEPGDSPTVRGVVANSCSDGADAGGLGALGALPDLELDALVLFKGAE